MLYLAAAIVRGDPRPYCAPPLPKFGDVFFRLGHRLHQGGAALAVGREGALDGRGQVRGHFNALGVGPEGLGHLRVVATEPVALIVLAGAQ